MFMRVVTVLRLFTPETHPPPLPRRSQTKVGPLCLCLLLVLVLVLVLALGPGSLACPPNLQLSTVIYTYLQLRSRWRCLNPNYSEPFRTNPNLSEPRNWGPVSGAASPPTHWCERSRKLFTSFHIFSHPVSINRPKKAQERFSQLPTDKRELKLAQQTPSDVTRG